MQKFCYISFLFLTVAALSAQSQVRQNVLSIASIEFPGQPVKLDTLDQIALYDRQDYFTCLVSLINSKNNKNESLNLKFGEKELDTVYSGVARGVILKTKGKILRMGNTNIHGLKGVEVELAYSAADSSEYFMCQRFLFANDTLIGYSFTCHVEDTAVLAGPRNKFLNSFRVNVDPKTVRQYTLTKEDSAYRFGYAVGRFLGVMVLLSVFGGIVALIALGINKMRKSRR